VGRRLCEPNLAKHYHRHNYLHDFHRDSHSRYRDFYVYSGLQDSLSGKASVYKLGNICRPCISGEYHTEFFHRSRKTNNHQRKARLIPQVGNQHEGNRYQLSARLFSHWLPRVHSNFNNSEQQFLHFLLQVFPACERSQTLSYATHGRRASKKDVLR